jgi:hypothetical protein
MKRSMRSGGAVFPEANGSPVPPSGAVSADALLKFGKAQPWRSYVTADRMADALRYRLGCLDTGERGPSCSYWVTPNGLRFRVDDPVADCASAPLICRDGSRQMVYSHAYATRLLRHVNMLIYGWAPASEKRQLRFV